MMRYQIYWDDQVNPNVAGTLPGLAETIIKKNQNLGFQWTKVWGHQYRPGSARRLGPHPQRPVVVRHQRLERDCWESRHHLRDRQESADGGTADRQRHRLRGIVPFSNPFIRIHNNWQYAYQLVQSRGNHSLRYGAEVRTTKIDLDDWNTPNGNFTFTGRYTGNAVADILLGYPSQSQRLIGPGVSNMRSWQLAGFVQDEWRVNGRSVAQLRPALRIPGAVVGGQQRVGRVRARPRPPGAGGDRRACRRSIREFSKNNFAPRVGVVYDLSGNGSRTVRAGYGIYYPVADQRDAARELSECADQPAPDLRGERNDAEHLDERSVPGGAGGHLAAGPGLRAVLEPGAHAPVERGHPAGDRLLVRGDAGLCRLGLGVSAAELQHQPARARAGHPAEPSSVSAVRRHHLEHRRRRRHLSLAAVEVRESAWPAGWSAILAYTWQKAINDVNDGGAGDTGNQNSYARDEQGLAGHNRAHRFTASVVYDFPFEQAILREWQLAGCLHAVDRTAIHPGADDRPREHRQLHGPAAGLRLRRQPAVRRADRGSLVRHHLLSAAGARHVWQRRPKHPGVARACRPWTRCCRAASRWAARATCSCGSKRSTC